MPAEYHKIVAPPGGGMPQTTLDIVPGTDKRDVSEVLDLLVVDETPFINMVGWGPESGSTKIEWLSENMGPGYVILEAVTGDGGLVVGDDGDMPASEAIKQVVEGTVLYHYSSKNMTHMTSLVVAVNDTTLITDVMEGPDIDIASAKGDRIYTLGATANSGSLPRTGQWRERKMLSNNFEILRQDVQITGSDAATDFYAIGKEDKHQLLMRMAELQRQRERVALYNVSTPRTREAAGGMNGVRGFMMEHGGNNVDNTTTTFTEEAINEMVGRCWDNASTKLVFLGARQQVAKFIRWDEDRIRMGPRDGRGGGYISHYLTDCNVEIELIAMRKVPVNIAFVLDTSKISLRAKNGRKSILQKLSVRGDFDEWQLLSEFSLEMRGVNLGQHGMFTQLSP